jgi:hypothetical protein
MSLNIADIFFYEELSRIVDHETGSQWLLSRSAKKCKISVTRDSTLSTPCRTPGQSAPASPRSESCMDDEIPSGYHATNTTPCINPCSASFSSSLLSMDVFSLARTESTSLDLALKNAALNLGTRSVLKPDPSILGLMFTDAAHHVLD